MRKQLKYPPFCDIIVVNFNGTSEKEIEKYSDYIYNYLNSNLDKRYYSIFKPMPSPIDKIQNKIRWRIIVKGKMTIETNSIFNKCLEEIYEKDLKHTRISVSVNPNSMM